LRVAREQRNSHIRKRPNSVETVRLGIIGAGELGSWMARQINLGGAGNRRVVAFFDDDSNKWNKRLCDVPVIGMPECIADGSWSDALDEVVIVMPSATPERRLQILALLRNANIRARLMPSLEELLSR